MRSVKKPLETKSLEEVVKAFDLSDKSLNAFLRKLIKWNLFEIRPKSMDHMLMKHAEVEPFAAWSTVTESQRRSSFPYDSGRSLVAMMTDFWCLQSPNENFELFQKENQNFPASLNHSVVFHTADKLDPLAWYLFETTCNVHSSDRFLMRGTVFEKSGRCVATYEQEGYKANDT
ncbi:hypothetical protein L596_016374 [Steinernema carpocapsae]|uniref:Acyl-CoA thioesterase 2 C-terminal domain-containing protein n=1 Tax=Steinernema carpocapsae TaxID=34508 RepID=A0A4U5NIK1_STECR|nr:hypothetical protein L596_016374 [Steinernema carpocapsae]